MPDQHASGHVPLPPPPDVDLDALVPPYVQDVMREALPFAEELVRVAAATAHPITVALEAFTMRPVDQTGLSVDEADRQSELARVHTGFWTLLDLLNLAEITVHDVLDAVGLGDPLAPAEVDRVKATYAGLLRRLHAAD